VKELLLKIKGMICGHCVSTVKSLIDEVDGVVYSEVDLASGKAKVVIEEGVEIPGAIVDRVNTNSHYKSEIESI
jgi:copper chaperone CopZ